MKPYYALAAMAIFSATFLIHPATSESEAESLAESYADPEARLPVFSFRNILRRNKHQRGGGHRRYANAPHPPPYRGPNRRPPHPPPMAHARKGNKLFVDPRPKRQSPPSFRGPHQAQERPRPVRQNEVYQQEPAAPTPPPSSTYREEEPTTTTPPPPPPPAETTTKVYKFDPPAPPSNPQKSFFYVNSNNKDSDTPSPVTSVSFFDESSGPFEVSDSSFIPNSASAYDSNLAPDRPPAQQTLDNTPPSASQPVEYARSDTSKSSKNRFTFKLIQPSGNDIPEVEVDTKPEVAPVSSVPVYQEPSSGGDSTYPNFVISSSDASSVPITLKDEVVEVYPIDPEAQQQTYGGGYDQLPTIVNEPPLDEDIPSIVPFEDDETSDDDYERPAYESYPSYPPLNPSAPRSTASTSQSPPTLYYTSAPNSEPPPPAFIMVDGGEMGNAYKPQAPSSNPDTPTPTQDTPGPYEWRPVTTSSSSAPQSYTPGYLESVPESPIAPAEPKEQYSEDLYTYANVNENEVPESIGQVYYKPLEPEEQDDDEPKPGQVYYKPFTPQAPTEVEEEEQAPVVQPYQPEEPSPPATEAVVEPVRQSYPTPTKDSASFPMTSHFYDFKIHSPSYPTSSSEEEPSPSYVQEPKSNPVDPMEATAGYAGFSIDNERFHIPDFFRNFLSAPPSWIRMSDEAWQQS